MTGSSGSSTESKVIRSHPTGTGVKKSSAGTKKVGKVGQKPGDGEKKWQAFFDSAREVTADKETVQALLFAALKEEASNEAEKSSPADVDNVKRLMAHVYWDIHHIATVQASKATPAGTPMERVFREGPSETDLELREVLVGVKNVIKSALSHQRNPEGPQYSAIWEPDEAMLRCMSLEDPIYERCSQLVAGHGWKLLSILAHSTAFLDAIFTVDAEGWNAVSTSISENAVSITIFAEGRSLEWWTELICLNSRYSPFLPDGFAENFFIEPRDKAHPHNWVVADKPEDVRPPVFKGKRQVNIENSIYRASAFINSRRPSCWPADRPYPEDPTEVRYSSIRPCLTCKSRTPCTCSFLTSLDIWHPLVELRDYGHKGVGVRALQWIPKNAVLDEYVGEIFPSEYAGDTVYGLDFSLPGRETDEVIATISAKRFGNWTRFINHSCEASTKFRTVTQGGRYRNVVQTVREIEMFEELTIDYGEGYWRNRICECGAEKCCSKMKIKVEDERETGVGGSR
ncbi:MAG: hypothetical protein Q9175_006325 [Cornicularia normoerica]